jgi:S-formylglutathione hydrolase
MQTYILEDLTRLLFNAFPLDEERQSITGHSMGGHGALTLAAKLPGRFKSVSAFSPICNPTQSDWGKKQFAAYLGSIGAGEAHDATCLADTGALDDLPILIDTGTDDQFGDLLSTEALAETLMRRRAEATIRLQKGYDHSYFFVSTFMEDHLAFHGEALWR